jgi:hypothetical protein
MRAGAARGQVGHFHEAGFYGSDVSYPGVGTEAGIAPVSGLRPGSRGSPPRRQPPVW